MRPDLSPGEALDRLLAYDNELRLERVAPTLAA